MKSPMKNNWWQSAFTEVYCIEYAEQDKLLTKRMLNFLTKILPQKGSVLDIACGYGRISNGLKKKGFVVVGVDYSPYMLEEAKKGDAVFLEGDMRHLPFQGTFDSAISMFTSFGYFEDKSDDFEVARNAYVALKSGGIYILDYITRQNSDEFCDIHRGGFSGRVRNYSKSAMKELLESVGFKVEHIYGHYYFGEFTEDSPRMIFVCKKM